MPRRSVDYPHAMTEQEQQHQIDVNRTEGAAVVAIRGEHDLYTAPALREQLSALVADGQAVVVDLSGCTFIDSSILGVLAGWAAPHARGRVRRSCVVLGDGEPAVRRIFEVTGLFGVFTVCDTLEEAVAATRDGGE